MLHPTRLEQRSIARTLAVLLLVADAACDGSGGGAGGNGGNASASGGSGGSSSGSSVGTGSSSSGSGGGGTSSGSGTGGGIGLPGYSCIACPPGFGTDNCYPVDDPMWGCGTGKGCPSPLFLHREPICANGGCALGACYPTWGDCDNDPMNGCETDLTTPGHCGSCGNACAPGQLCTANGCAATCPAPLVNCNGACVNTATSPNHCSACFFPCSAGFHQLPWCSLGLCDAQCKPGFLEKNGNCYDTDSSKECCGPACETCTPPAGGLTVCDAGTCVGLCPPGRTLCNNKCVLLATDLAHCGACNSPSCPGACVGGMCDPSLTPLVAAGVGAVTQLAVDDVAVYFPTAGGVSRVAKQGGAPVVLANGAPHRIALDDAFVYWSEPGAVRRVAKQGGASELLGSVGTPGDITVRDGRVYWTDNAVLSILSAPSDGSSAPVTVALSLTPVIEIEVDATHLYWTEYLPGGGPLRMILRDGQGMPSQVATIEMGVLAIDAEHVYTDSFTSLTVAVCIGKGPIFQAGLGTVDALEVDDTYAYLFSTEAFSFGLNRVLKCGKSYTNLGATILPPFAVDNGFIYHLSGGDLVRIPK